VSKNKWEMKYKERFQKSYNELRWLYCELYHNDVQGLEWLCNSLKKYYEDRPVYLKKLDCKREETPGWYKGNELLGMMMYVDAFAGSLHGVQDKLGYIKSCGVNYLHFMPLLDSPAGKDDGGYAVADFRKVNPKLGTIENLKALTAACHKEGISCCLDFVMNHTSDEHEWAKAARNGDPVAQSRYFFYDNWEIPDEFEKTIPQVFPTTAPGNFTQLEDCGKIVMTTFYPYQWDLNYANCMVFNDMVGNMLFLANCGIDIIRLDAVPYIWKELGTNCRNLKQVHSLVRMMRIVTEIVCPGVLLLGEVVMEPSEVVPYFGTLEKPECHMLYNVTTMASTWHTVASKDVGLLRHQMDQISSLPKEYVFQNYLRCHDDIGWGLDYQWLAQFGITEAAHKKYLNDILTGKSPGSDSRGELYNDDPRLMDARLCGTTASLCGLEAALYEKNPEKIEKALKRIIMLHAFLLTQSGIPVLYSGDETGQLNDYSYKDIKEKCADSRYLHRGNFPWENLEAENENYKISMYIFQELGKLEKIRSENRVFHVNADVWTFDTGSSHVLGIGRYLDGKELLAYFNFSGYDLENIWMPMDQGAEYIHLLSGKTLEETGPVLAGYEFCWYLRHW